MGQTELPARSPDEILTPPRRALRPSLTLAVSSKGIAGLRSNLAPFTAQGVEKTAFWVEWSEKLLKKAARVRE